MRFAFFLDTKVFGGGAGGGVRVQGAIGCSV